MEKENKRSCPACGARIPASVQACPACGLTGLNRHFLSREGYEKWVREVLEPHKASMAPKVFAGNGYGLILTIRGELYGIGRNDDHQILDENRPWCCRPVLMAENVISAAAGSHYTIYVTRDGQIHWRGNGAENMPQAADVRTVYAEWGRDLYEETRPDRFWLEKNSGEIFVLGADPDASGAETDRTLVYEFPEAEALYGNNIFWTADGSIGSPKEYFQRSEEYQELVRRHGVSNVKLEIQEVQSTKQKVLNVLWKPVYDYYAIYRAKLYLRGKAYWEPKPFREKWLADSAHRIGSRPVLEEEYLRDGWEKEPGIKKVSSGELKLCLLEGGTVVTGGETLHWLKQPVMDLAVGPEITLLACKNGDILWKLDADFRQKNALINGTMQVCRLSEEE